MLVLDTEYAEDWINCPVPHSDSTYALTVVGDSMTSPPTQEVSVRAGVLASECRTECGLIDRARLAI